MNNKWTNLGDVNHREHGGQFVQVDRQTETIEVVTVDIIEDCNNKNIYRLQEADYSFDELRDEFNNVGPCFGFADWKRHIGMNFYDIAEQLAVDMISYYGGTTEGENDSNYYKLLARHGIQRCHIV